MVSQEVWCDTAKGRGGVEDWEEVEAEVFGCDALVKGPGLDEAEEVVEA